MPRLNWPFFANFNLAFNLSQPSLAFNLSSHAVQVTNTEQDLSQKKKHPSTINHFRTRRQPEKAARTYFDRCNLSVGSDDKSLISDLRWLHTVSSTYIWMGRYNHSLSLDATIMVSKTAQSFVNTFSSFF